MLIAMTLSFGVTLACVLALLFTPAKRFALDRPNRRSLHVVPVPRTGGLAILAGVAGAMTYAWSGELTPLLPSLALAAVSFGDDLIGLPALSRLSAHVLAAAGAIWLLVPGADAITIALLVLGLAWLTNAFNFMDGSDGLAGGMAVIGFAACATAACLDGVMWLASACAAVSSATFAFLLFNFPPARIFMGDVGSIFLGFLTGAIGIAGWRAGVWDLWFPLLVFSPFAVDATVTLTKRAIRADRIWQAHREHYYQRLVRMGFGHRRTALMEYALMLVCAVAALAIRNSAQALQAATLLAFAVGYGAIARSIDARWMRHSLDHPQ